MSKRVLYRFIRVDTASYIFDGQVTGDNYLKNYDIRWTVVRGNNSNNSVIGTHGKVESVQNAYKMR